MQSTGVVEQETQFRMRAEQAMQLESQMQEPPAIMYPAAHMVQLVGEVQSIQVAGHARQLPPDRSS